jgi:uncharacterized repeat protein (TIGR04076 family)
MSLSKLTGSRSETMKSVPIIKVLQMEFFEGFITRKQAKENGAICSTGIKNAYRYAFLKGQGGSIKEETWNKFKHEHICCQSRVAWRHKTKCPKLESYD